MKLPKVRVESGGKKKKSREKGFELKLWALLSCLLIIDLITLEKKQPL